MMRAVLRFTSANRECVTHADTLRERLGPLCCNTQRRGQRGIEMRPKETDEEKEARTPQRSPEEGKCERGVTKKKRSRRVK